MTDLNKLADAVKNAALRTALEHGSHCAQELIQAEALLRAVAVVDLAKLLHLVEEYRNAPIIKDVEDRRRAILESALRLVLAQRVPPGCVAFDEAQERAAFESHLKAELKTHWLYNNPNGHELVDLMVSVTPDEVNGHKQTYAGRYVDKGVEAQWHGWRARAAAAPQAKEQGK